MTTRVQWLAVIGILAALTFALAAAMVFSPEIARVQPGSRAPDARFVDVMTGDSLSMRDFDGEVVLLNIWATWCLPCEAEMPSMQRLHEELGPRGLRVLAVSIDQTGRDVVREWSVARNLDFTIVQDRSGRIQQTYQTTGVPESFVISRRGEIVKKIIGATEWDHASHKVLFNRLLEEE